MRNSNKKIVIKAISTHWTNEPISCRVDTESKSSDHEPILWRAYANALEVRKEINTMVDTYEMGCDGGPLSLNTALGLAFASGPQSKIVFLAVCINLISRQCREEATVRDRCFSSRKFGRTQKWDQILLNPGKLTLG
jgi:hypothetical protein